MKVDKSVFVADGAKIVGNVTIDENSSVWFNAVIRGDSNSIYIGKNSNIQDNVVIHTSKNYSVEIKDNVSIGHGAILHGCKIGNNVLIGMGAIILDGVVIEDNCIIGAGSLVTQNKVIESNNIGFGNPFSIKRKITEEEKKHIIDNAFEYVNKANTYKK